MELKYGFAKYKVYEGGIEEYSYVNGKKEGPATMKHINKHIEFYT